MNGRSWIAVLGFSVGCVPHLAIEGAPCPCPTGYQCCPTLHSCLEPGSACPDRFPQSSGQQCDRDADCPASEICAAWTAAGSGDVIGLRQCRQRCSGEFSCADGERCRPTLHDAQPTTELNLVSACLPQEQPASCAAASCDACPTERQGELFCADGDVHGCFFSVDATCGVICQDVEVIDCDLRGCEETETSAKCAIPSYDTEPCDVFDCAACPAEQSPHQVYCSGDSVVACYAMPYQGEGCGQICLQQTIESCQQACSEQGGAHCQ
ncbi:MAG: hypothetical protein JXR83_15715 [Deltaproteobacteria bacterium]|nr:hypothetical protein [Deltaproteobacteria bacterium]